MQIIKNYVSENSVLLFKHEANNQRIALFDSKGFHFTEEAQILYNQIKNQPHLYVAWTNNHQGNFYVGKSFQNGGRWKRQHAYHLGTLAFHLLNTIRYDDQNHSHWIERWMNTNTMNNIAEGLFSVELKDPVYISFIPFHIYSNEIFNNLNKYEIQKTNKHVETLLIESFIADNIQLLNIQKNMKQKTRLRIIENGPWALDAADDFINKKINLVCIAVNALTIYGCFAKAVGGLTNEEAEEYVLVANQMNESITLYPKLHLTIVPLSIDSNRNDFNDRAIMYENIKRSIEINEESIKSSKMIFAFERRFEFNIDLALEILKELDMSYSFKATKSIQFYFN